jgi:hypothetical protein
LLPISEFLRKFGACSRHLSSNRLGPLLDPLSKAGSLALNVAGSEAFHDLTGSSALQTNRNRSVSNGVRQFPDSGDRLRAKRREVPASDARSLSDAARRFAAFPMAGVENTTQRLSVFFVAAKCRVTFVQQQRRLFGVNLTY